MSNIRKIRVAQFGTWSKTHSDHVMSAMRTMPQLFEIVGVAEPNDERRRAAEKRAAYRDLRWLGTEEILSDKTIDAVMVETHETEQDRAALLFAENGFNVHVDKPGGATDDFLKAIEAAKSNGKVFHMGYMYRYNPAVVDAMQLVKSGKLGKINYVEAQMSARYAPNGIYDWFKGMPGGMMFYLGCHLVDLVYGIMGKPQEVINHSFSTSLNPEEVVDTGFVLYKYESGISFVKASAAEVNGDARRYLVISGSEGTAEIAPLEIPVEADGVVCPQSCMLKTTYNGYLNKRGFDHRSKVTTYPVCGRYDDMLVDLVKKVCGEKEDFYTYDYEAEVHRLLMQSVNK